MIQENLLPRKYSSLWKIMSPCSNANTFEYASARVTKIGAPLYSIFHLEQPFLVPSPCNFRHWQIEWSRVNYAFNRFIARKKRYSMNGREVVSMLHAWQLERIGNVRNEDAESWSRAWNTNLGAIWIYIPVQCVTILWSLKKLSSLLKWSCMYRTDLHALYTGNVKSIFIRACHLLVNLSEQRGLLLFKQLQHFDRSQ